MVRKLESSRSIANHMKNQPVNQPQSQVNQVKHRRVNLTLHKKEGQEEKAAVPDQPITNRFRSVKTKQHATSQEAALAAQDIRFHNNNRNRELSTCCKCRDTLHRPEYNCPTRGYQCKTKKVW